MKLLYTLFICLLTIQYSFAQNALIDSLFSDGEHKGYSVFSINNTVFQPKFAISAQEGGYITCGLAFRQPNSSTFFEHSYISKIDECGGFDSTFNEVGYLSTGLSDNKVSFNACHQLVNGKIMVAGAAGTSGINLNGMLVRFNPDGSLDNTFGIDGVIKHVISATGIDQGFQSIYPKSGGGYVCQGVSQRYFSLVGFNEDGSLDENFGEDNGMSLILNPVNSVSSEEPGFGKKSSTSGKFSFAQIMRGPDFNSYLTIGRFNADGTVDSQFGNQGLLNTNILISGVHGMEMLSDESMIVAFRVVENSNIVYKLVKLNEDGSINNAFGTNGFTTIGNSSTIFVSNLLKTNDDDFLILGSIKPSGSTYRCWVSKVNANGALLQDFANNGNLIFNFNSTNRDGNLSFALQNQQNNKILLFGSRNITSSTLGSTDFMLAVRMISESNVPRISRTENTLFANGNGTFQWFLNGETIAGATSNSHNLSNLGTYTVELTDETGCQYRSDEFVVNNISVGIELIQSNIPIEIYPNPAESMLNIKMDGNALSNYVIYDASGRTIQAGITNNQLDISNLKPGLYTLQLQGKKHINHQIFIKK